MSPAGPKWTRTEKPRDLRKAMSRLFGYMGEYRKEVIVGIVCVLISSILSLIGPQYLSIITDEVSGSILGSIPADMSKIASIGIMLIIIYAASMLFSTAEHYIIGASSEKVGAKMRNDLSRKINTLPLGYLDSMDTGDVMSRMTNDTDTISKSCSESISITITAVTMLIGSLVMMFYTEWRLAVVAIIPALMGFCILYYITHHTQKYFRAQQRDLGRMNSLIEETYYGHDIVRIYNNKGRSKKRFTEINESLYDSAFKARVITSMMPQMMNFISNLGYVIVCVVGSIMILNGQIGYGVIVAFIVYIRQFTHPMVQIADSTAMMQSVASASERIFEFLDKEDMSLSIPAKIFEPIKGEVEFKNVHFSYIEGKEIIHGLSLKIKPGSKIAIVGPTGSGKTTIANLLMRFYEIDSGDILIDGVSIRNMSREQVHDMFSMVLQDTWLFEGTLKENIKFTKEDASDEDIIKACEAVGISRYIESLPNGYDTLIGDAANLSVGQRQQMTIARAIVKNAPLIILDEATSSIDTMTEKHIQHAMDHLTKNRTSFVIAHRLSTIKNSDLILVMKDGQVVESGTHHQLLNLNGFYKVLYDSQFENCE